MTEEIKNGLSDAAKTGMSLPFVIMVGAMVLAAALAFGRVQASLDYQEKLAAVNSKLTESQIEASSLRNSALVFSQENGRKDAEIRRLETQVQTCQQQLSVRFR